MEGQQAEAFPILQPVMGGNGDTWCDDGDGGDDFELPEPESADSPTAIGSGKPSRPSRGKDTLLRMGWTKGSPASPLSAPASVKRGSHSTQSWSPVMAPPTPDPSTVVREVRGNPATPPPLAADELHSADGEDTQETLDEAGEGVAARFGWASKLLGEEPGDHALKLWSREQEVEYTGRRSRLATRLYDEEGGAPGEGAGVGCDRNDGGDNDKGSERGEGGKMAADDAEEEKVEQVSTVNAGEVAQDAEVIDQASLPGSSRSEVDEAVSLDGSDGGNAENDSTRESDDKLVESVRNSSSVAAKAETADGCGVEETAEPTNGFEGSAEQDDAAARGPIVGATVVPRLNLSALSLPSEDVSDGKANNTHNEGAADGGDVASSRSVISSSDSDHVSSRDTSMKDEDGWEASGNDSRLGCGHERDDGLAEAAEPSGRGEPTTTTLNAGSLNPEAALQGLPSDQLKLGSEEEAGTPALRATSVDSPGARERSAANNGAATTEHHPIADVEVADDESSSAPSRLSSIDSNSDGSGKTVLWQSVYDVLSPPRPSVVPQLQLGSLSKLPNSPPERSVELSDDGADNARAQSTLYLWIQSQSESGTFCPTERDVGANGVLERDDEEAAESGGNGVELGHVEGDYRDAPEEEIAGLVVAAQAAAAASLLEGWKARLLALEEAQRCSIADAQRTQRAFLRDAAAMLADLKVSTQSEVARVLGDVTEAVRSSQLETRQTMMSVGSNDGLKEATKEGFREGWDGVEGRLVNGVAEAVRTVIQEKPQSVLEGVMAQVEVLLSKSVAKVEAAGKESADRLAAAVADVRAELDSLREMHQKCVRDGVVEAVATVSRTSTVEGNCADDWRARMEARIDRAVAASEGTREVVTNTQTAVPTETLSQLALQLEASVQQANDAALRFAAMSSASVGGSSTAAESRPATDEHCRMVLQGLQTLQVQIRSLEESITKKEASSSAVASDKDGHQSTPDEYIDAVRVIERATLSATAAAEQAGASAVKAAEAAGASQQVVADAAEMVVTASKSLKSVMLETSEATRRVVHQAAEAILTTTDAAAQMVSESRNASFSNNCTPDGSFDATHPYDVHSSRGVEASGISSPPSRGVASLQWQPMAMSQSDVIHSRQSNEYSKACHKATSTEAEPEETPRMLVRNHHEHPESALPPPGRHETTDHDVQAHPDSPIFACDTELQHKCSDIRDPDEAQMPANNGDIIASPFGHARNDDVAVNARHTRSQHSDMKSQHASSQPPGRKVRKSSSSGSDKQKPDSDSGWRFRGATILYSDEDDSDGSDVDSDDDSVSISRIGRQRVTSMLQNSRRVVEGLGKKNLEIRGHGGTMRSSLVFSDSESEDDGIVLSFAARRLNESSPKAMENATKPRDRVSLPPPLPHPTSSTKQQVRKSSSSAPRGTSYYYPKESESQKAYWDAEEAAIAAATAPLNRPDAQTTGRAAIGDFLQTLSSDRKKSSVDRSPSRASPSDDDSEEEDETLFIAAKRYALNRHYEGRVGSLRSDGSRSNGANLFRAVDGVLRSSRGQSKSDNAYDVWSGGADSDGNSEDEDEDIFTDLRWKASKARA